MEELVKLALEAKSREILLRRRGSAGKDTIAKGIVVIQGTQNTPPHTYKTAKGKFCATDRWFDLIALVYDIDKAEDEHGGKLHTMLALQGSGKYSVYYPESTVDDFRAIMQSGSSGRWLHKWSQKSNYKRF